MEMGVTEEVTPRLVEPQSMKDTESAENFQKFIYQLFEKNGILNDLRAYLRGHIVNVLKNAQTGNPPACQKSFTQRLDLTFQSLNILIAEYLMRLEFSYSFSVFISEIPLANMVFPFAKMLMKSSPDDNAAMRFSNDDVWSILNYLGIQCDSEHASHIMETYTSSNSPLLLCILEGMPMYKKEPVKHQPIKSSDESTSSGNSSDTVENKCSQKEPCSREACKHYAFCKTCQNRMTKIKDKYRKKKKSLVQSVKDTSARPFSVENLMRNISAMERSLIDEMFEQLKTVYEAEVEMLKAEEDKRLKRSLVSHAAQLKKKRDEMEASFSARESVLERNVQQKKRFLWGLARTLRDQHARLARAMGDLQAESGRLADKENSLKAQLIQAEDVLRKRGEEMRAQITNELAILEGHLASMKKERDSINIERTKLELMRSDASRQSETRQHDLHSHHDLLRNELEILKKYLETSRLTPKCVIDRSTVTDISDVTSKISVVLNNGQGLERSSDSYGKLKSKQLINDLKKQKNVNFSQSNLDEIYRERSRDRSRSSASSEGGDAVATEIELNCEQNRDYSREAVLRLTEENERLKTFARQQRDHIDELSSAQARLQAELTAVRFRAMESATHRPRTAPTVMPAQTTYFTPTVNSSASVTPVNLSWSKGAGEELSLFSNAQPRILLPGDNLPFIGVLRDRNCDTRRWHLISQWRCLRRRVSPLGGVAKPRDRSPHAGPAAELLAPMVYSAGTTAGVTDAPQTSHEGASSTEETNNDDVFQSLRESLQQRPKDSVKSDVGKNREKSPKSVLREAKEKLRTKASIRDPAPAPRDRSPTSVLREAKLRLRKLEIEAEAVEQSYLDFRKKQSELRCERRAIEFTKHDPIVAKEVRNLEIKRSTSLHELDEAYRSEIDAKCKLAEKCFKTDIDKYLQEYQDKFNIVEAHFRNRITTAEIIKPVPEAFSEAPKHKSRNEGNNNLLETPLTEFRKLYNSNKKLKINSPPKTPEYNLGNVTLNRKDTVKKAKGNKNAELEILKQNIKKIYNLPNDNTDANIIEAKESSDKEDNLLRVEIESVSEQSIKSRTRGVSLLVESVANVRVPETNQQLSTQMTIIVSPKRNSPNQDIGDKNTERPNSRNKSKSKDGAETKSPVKINNDNGSRDSQEIDIEINDKSKMANSPGRKEISYKSLDDQKFESSARNIDQLTPRSPKPHFSPDWVHGFQAISAERPKRSLSPEQAAHLTRNYVLDAIFNVETIDQISSIHLDLDKSPKEIPQDSLSETEKGDEYADDFSADVDNYNSRSDVDDTPISLPKTSEDENFWDS